MKNLLLSLSLSLISTGFAQASDWTTDYKAALAEAKAEKKLVLIEFSGDDAYGYGKSLNKEVLSQAAFQSYADKTFVLVRIDLSTTSSLSDNLKQQNAALGNQFGIQGFPTLLVLNSSEKPIEKIEGYDPGTGANGIVAKFQSVIRN